MNSPLSAGIRRFQSEVFPAKSSLFNKLSTGQAPRVLMVTCSDSRVVPHLITQTEPGDLFVIRNAGNVVPPYAGNGSGEEATVEYAVSVLGVEHVVVCGHSSCGAMGGLMKPESVSALPSVARWLETCRSTRDVVNARAPKASDAARVGAAVEENARQQLRNLETHPSVATALAKGKLELHAWVYDIGSGSVRGFDSDQGQYRELGGDADESHATTAEAQPPNPK